MRRQSDELTTTHASGALRWKADCGCRFYAPASKPLLPHQLALRIGQIFLSKRLSDQTQSSCSRCDGRRNIAWVLSPQLLTIHAQLSAPYLSLHLPTCTPRVTSRGGPLWRHIISGDLQGVQEAFATGRASVWDVDDKGYSVFAVSFNFYTKSFVVILMMNQHACVHWLSIQTQERLEIIRFLVSADAEAVLFLK